MIGVAVGAGLALAPAPSRAQQTAGQASLPAPPPEAEFAAHAILVDLGSGRVLYEKRAAEAFLPASVTKTMTTYVAFNLIAQGKLKPDQVFVESNDAYRKWHTTGSRMFIERGQPVSVDQLLTGIMTISANDGAVVLAEGAAGSVEGWVAMMNATARQLGMNDSHFNTPNGYMDNQQTYVSARDLAKLAGAMIEQHADLYHRYVGQPGMTFNRITQKNHDPLLGIFPGADGIKTGFTGEAHYNYLGSAERDGRRLVLVVAGVERPKDRVKAAKALMEWGFSQWDGHKIFAAGERLGAAQVQGGVSPTVGLEAPRTLYATLPHGAGAKVSMRITYDGPLHAPIAKGAPVAHLEVKVGQEAPSRLTLVAADDVPVGGVMDRLRAGFARIMQ